MPTVVYPSSRVESERTIALARVALAATATLALWLDPSDTAGSAAIVYWAYVVYAAGLAVWTLTGWEKGDWFPLLTHGIDIAVFSALQYLTLGPSSPFYVYFVFSMFCAAIRWGWRGTLVTGATVLLFYVALALPMAVSLTPPFPFQLNRFIIRVAYLLVSITMLVYLGRYEARLRLEIERLAQWPVPHGASPDVALTRVVEYGARLMQSGCVLVVWEASDEPGLHEARWTPTDTSIRHHPPDAPFALTDETLARSTFICSGAVQEARGILLADHAGRLVRRDIFPLSDTVRERLTGSGLASAPFKTDFVTGRVYFSDLGTPPSEALPLTEVVSREIASSLDQLLSARQRQEIAAREERIRVARDLHDGVLQGLTGVRLELRAMATQRPDSPGALREQLVSLERALAMEQRELRFFISGLEPGSNRRIDRQSTLAQRLDSVRERLALEWKTPVTLRVSPRVTAVPGAVEEALPLMINEAVVNALKHANPSRVTVDVESADGHIRVAVSDDGRGFPFKGRFDHDALALNHDAPRSLFDRVSALGGQLSIESSDQGSRVEMLLSL